MCVYIICRSEVLESVVCQFHTLCYEWSIVEIGVRRTLGENACHF